MPSHSKCLSLCISVLSTFAPFSAVTSVMLKRLKQSLLMWCREKRVWGIQTRSQGNNCKTTSSDKYYSTRAWPKRHAVKNRDSIGRAEPRQTHEQTTWSSATLTSLINCRLSSVSLRLHCRATCTPCAFTERRMAEVDPFRDTIHGASWCVVHVPVLVVREPCRRPWTFSA